MLRLEMAGGMVRKGTGKHSSSAIPKKTCPALKFDRLSPKLIKKNKGVIKAKFS